MTASAASLFARRLFALSTCALFVGLGVMLSAQSSGLGKPEPGSRGRTARGDVNAPVPGALSGSAAVAALGGDLGQRVRARGRSPDVYAALLSSDASLWITSEGQLMFVDVAEHDAAADSDGDSPEAAGPTGPPPTPLFLLSNGMPVHHSKPGAPWTIYLDLDGEASFSSSAWGFSNRQITGLTLDADAAAFNADEQALVSRIWGRVAEDWAPFDVDVTTERPGVIGSTVLWAIVGKSPTELGFAPNVGGVALFDIFSFGYMPFGLQTPTFTFWEWCGPTDHSTIADVITQENGHMFGLLHDGVVTDTGSIAEYYGGHGTGATSWGPVMGSPLARNVTQWSRADYPGGITPFSGRSHPQDDIAIIAGKLGFRADDFADTVAGAAPLALPTAGFITSATDLDVFALPLADDVHIEVTPFRAGESTDGGNLDVAIDIVNASGTVVASVDDVLETAAALSANLPRTPHFLRVRPSFDPASYPAYGSLGGYTITATFVRSVRLLDIREPVSSSISTPGRTVPLKFTLTDAVAGARALLLPAPVDAPAGALAEALCKPQQNGLQHCNLRLPSTLAPGTYWLLVQYQNIDGSWVTARAVLGGTADNPLPIVVD